MAPLAKAFIDMGWKVTGSDQEKVYPPESTYLQNNNILYCKSYSAKNVPHEADLVVVGRSALLVDANNPEYLQAKSLGLETVSYPEVIGEFVVKENSIVIAGTYGKTTISALVAWILTCAKLNPSYMIGGIPLNLIDGVKITNSEWSVVEGDEIPSLLKTGPLKFMFYKPKYLLLTATKWDHPEIYKSEDQYKEAFIKLVELLPSDGLLVYAVDSVDKLVIEKAKCRKVSYSLDNPPVDNRIIFIRTQLLGKPNLENIYGSFVLCKELGVKEEVILKAIETFSGVKTRLEFLGKIGGRYLYWDFAQHPEKVKGSLTALKECYLNKRIICIYDPATTGLKYKESLDWFRKAFDNADLVIVTKVNYISDVSKENRVIGPNLVKSFGGSEKVIYMPINETIIRWVKENTKNEDVIVFMSSGGLKFTELIEKIKRELGEPEGQEGQEGKEGQDG